MREKKVHFIKGSYQRYACGAGGNPMFSTSNYTQVTCENCKKTKAFLKVQAEAESKRELSKEEFDEPWEVLRIATKPGHLLKTECKYKQGWEEDSPIVAKLGSGYCKKCKHNKGTDRDKQTVKCSYLHDNKPPKPYTKNKYLIEYSDKQGNTIKLDVYDQLAVLNLPNAEIEHTFKKLVRCGKGDKTLLQDLKEAYVQLGMGIDRIERVEGLK